MTAPARTAAFRALRAMAVHGHDLPTALAASHRSLSTPRDRALALDIVAGTVRWKRALDHLIAAVSSRTLSQIELAVLIVLELSVYQLLHLDRVPASAVVDDAVDLAREARKPGAAGFVNAVLRSLLRQQHRLPLPARPDAGNDAAVMAYLGITHSHPDWLIARWLAREGFERTEQWVRFNNAAAHMTLRVNRLKATRDEAMGQLANDGVETEPTTYSPDGLVVIRGNPLQRPADGLVVVQDEASQLVPWMLDARPGMRVLDLCAAPGGKSTALAGMMEDHGLLVACDVRPRRMRLLRATVGQSGTHAIRVVQVGNRGALPFAAVFDRVLVDAPCSGLGTLRRDPDIKWRRQETDLPALAHAQRELLERAAQVVGPAGWLVYATCSSEPEENDQVVDAFLADHPDFRQVDPRLEIPDLPPTLESVIDATGRLRTDPARHGLEAFFAAVLARR